MRKKLALTLLAGVLVLGLSEAAFRAAYFTLKHQGFPLAACNEAMDRLAIQKDDVPQGRGPGEGLLQNDDGFSEAIHPYFGYVRDPSTTLNTTHYGFPLSEGDPVEADGQQGLRVAIFGGSFAMGMAKQARDALKEGLRELGEPVQIVTFALEGYKQPQQLLVLSYFLALGGHFDVVINLDGFNEVALPQADNIPLGVNPFYPREWYNRVANLPGTRTVRLVGEIQVFRWKRANWATFMSRVPGRFSAIRGWLWQRVDHAYEIKTAYLREAMLTRDTGDFRDFLATGPESGLSLDSSLYPAIAQHWARCSLQMKALCDLYGIVYLHFLQPNQYDPNSKPLSEQELHEAILENHPYSQGVLAGYSLLRQEGSNLAVRGVDFHDLSLIFADHPETLYIDSCCHVNLAGYEIMARRIASHVVEAMASKVTSGS